MKSIKGFAFIGMLLFAIAGVKVDSTKETIKGNIFTAIRSIDYTSINVLLSDGTNVDTVDRAGNTPLIVAAGIGNPRIVDIILSHKPNINKQNKQGVTPLILAAQTGQLHIVKKLVARGADVTIRSNTGETAGTLAAKFGHEQIVKFFKELRTQVSLVK